MSQNIKRLFPFGLVVLLLWITCIFSKRDSGFTSAWPDTVERPWIGPDFWANRLQDWRQSDGRLECIEGSNQKPMRTVHLLTRRVGKNKGTLIVSVHTGRMNPSESVSNDAAAGFLIGSGAGMDYRAVALIHHSTGPMGGLFFGIDGLGRLFIRDFADSLRVLAEQDESPGRISDVQLELEAKPTGAGYRLELSAAPLMAESDS